MSVADRLKKIRQRIEVAAVKSGRPASAVRLLAVSKLQPTYKIKEAALCGQIDFAENYLQEAALKFDTVENARWHFIGRIQSNKVKMIAGHFAIIHSVDRFSVARNLDQLNVGKPQDIFLQFNVAAEDSKGGASELELENLMNGVSRCENLRILGLMVMPPQTNDAESARPYFVQAREFMQRLRRDMAPELAARHPLNELSMGTSQDFEVAIEEGATWVRIGTEIFGPRDDYEKEMQ